MDESFRGDELGVSDSGYSVWRARANVRKTLTQRRGDAERFEKKIQKNW